jgi:hypothetical protein
MHRFVASCARAVDLYTADGLSDERRGADLGAGEWRAGGRSGRGYVRPERHIGDAETDPSRVCCGARREAPWARSLYLCARRTLINDRMADDLPALLGPRSRGGQELVGVLRSPPRGHSHGLDLQ